MKTSKYLICNDILAAEGQPAEFILHNHHPRFLAKVEELDFDEIENRPEKPFADILYVNGDAAMVIYRLTLTELYERAEDDDVLDELFSLELPGLKILQSSETWTVIYNGVIAEFTSEEDMDEFLEHDLDIEPLMLDQGVINQFE